ncbi:MAG: hypothetical protein WBA70_05155, partial [Thermodesulfobacteriota bacterium]
YHGDGDFAEVAILYDDNDKIFKFKKVWKAETTLAQLVRSLFPDTRREYSPDWLAGQRLDIYIPSLQVAIEYQGEQHYNPIEHFGGKKGLKKTKERDKRKRKLCRDSGIILIDWKYNEQITKEVLVDKLNEHGINY